MLPASAVLANAVNYLVALPLLFAFILISGVIPTVSVLLLPCVFLLLTIMAIGLGALLASLCPFFRICSISSKFFLRCGVFLTPIVYDISLIPEPWRPWYALNPMVGIVEFIHTVFLGQPLHEKSLAISVVGTLGILLIGLWVFRRCTSLH